MSVLIDPPWKDLLINISASFVFALISIFTIEFFQKQQDKYIRSSLQHSYISYLSAFTSRLVHNLRPYFEIEFSDIQEQFELEVLNDHRKLSEANKFLISNMVILNRNIARFYTPSKLGVLKDALSFSHKDIEHFLNRYGNLGLISIELQKVLIELVEEKMILSSLEVFPELLTSSTLINSMGTDIAPQQIITLNNVVDAYLKYLLNLSDIVILEFKENEKYLLK